MKLLLESYKLYLQKRRGQGLCKSQPLVLFCHSSLYKMYLLHRKNRGISCGEIKFSCQLFSQFLYWSPDGVTNKAGLLYLKIKWEIFLYEPLWRWRCALGLSEWGLFSFISHLLGGHTMEPGSREIILHWPLCVWISLWKSKCTIALT